MTLKLAFVDIFHQFNRTIKYMTRVILDVPSSKMKPFLQAVTNLGIEKDTIQFREISRRHKQNRGTLFTLHKIYSSFILFDWEYFSNELEYE